MICLHQGLLINYCIIFYFSLLCFLFFYFCSRGNCRVFWIVVSILPFLFEKKILPMFLSNATPSKNISFFPNTHQIDLSFDRILQYVYTNTSIHIHMQINSNQSNQINHVISCDHFGDAVFLAGLLQKPSKFLVLSHNNFMHFFFSK